MPIEPYLFTLRPVDTFFFGGERTFGYDGERSKGSAAANYFVASNRYPQQTALLGMLRYKILEAKGWLAKNGKPVSAEAPGWIGQRGFQVNPEPAKSETPETVKQSPFGHIHGLSPLFWLEQDTPYLMAPKDQGMTVVWLPGTVSSYLGQGVEQKLPHVVEGYKAKDGLTRQLIDRAGKRCLLDYDKDYDKKPQNDALNGPYMAQTQEGIAILKNPDGSRKSDDEAEKEQGFYKQTYYRFASTNWSFGFVAWLATEAADTLTTHLQTNGWATLGGEGRPFRLTMRRAENVTDLLTLPDRPATDGRQRLTLLSDAFVTNEIYKHCDFAITETVDFRPIETSTTVTNYAKLNTGKKSDTDSPNKAKKYQLLERGSVFYATADQITKATALLDAPRHFCRIGYNAYQITGQPPSLFQPTKLQ